MTATFESVKKLALQSPFAGVQGDFASSLAGLGEVGVGEWSAEDARSIYFNRGESAAAGGIETRGMEETLACLRRLPAAARVRLFHLRADDAESTILVGPDDAVVGWITVFRRRSPGLDFTT